MFMSKTTELLNSALLLQLGDATSSVLRGRLRPMTGMGGKRTLAARHWCEILEIFTVFYYLG
jgi:hypothetical protein